MPPQYAAQPLMVQQPSLQSLGQPLHSISIPPLHLSILKMSNVPTDLSAREARAVFALVLDELASVEVKEYLVYAYFKNVSTCAATAKLLDNKYIFGADYPPVKVEYDHALPALAGFNGLRISPDDEDKRVQRSRFVFGDPFLEPKIDLSDLSAKSLEEEKEGGYDKTKGYDKAFEKNKYDKNFEKNFEKGYEKNFDKNLDKNLSNNLTNFEKFDKGYDKPEKGEERESNFEPLDAGKLSDAPLGFEIGAFESRDYDSWASGSSPGVDWASASSGAAAPSTGAGDRRRTSSAFFNTLMNSGSSAPPATTAQQLAQGPPTAAALQTAKTPAKATSGTSTPSGTKKESVADLSLLARVPPPANPADQNPPCNTLYVGNLPPDATEAELRALFSPQKGFRRLSFRTKNQTQSTGANGSTTTHNHGPMCFVEFEDVAHATRALAELYGRALPRPNGSNGKGGIRLSFLKNPLGVRGPGNPRRTSTNQVLGIQVGSSVGNYGYSNYKQ